MAKQHALLAPYRPTAEDPFDVVKAAHLLNRAGFGGTSEEIERVMELGPADAVEWLLDFPNAGAEEQSREDLPDLSAIEGFPRNTREQREQMAGLTEEQRTERRQMIMRGNRQAIQATSIWWLRRMSYGPHPLQEKLALFWHGHFTTSAQDVQSARRIWQQNDLLRRMSAGNFGEFVHAISRDPAMLSYLNNNQNRAQSPNENFARELMELFTLGIGHYTEEDVREAARAFTGWTHDGDQFVFRRAQHDSGAKTLFGAHGNFGGEEIVNLILGRWECARHVAGRLFRYFVAEVTDDGVVDALGQVLWDSGYELRPMLRTLLNSRAFYSPIVVGGQIKSPVQLLCGTVRMLGLEMPEQRFFTNNLRLMGQVPFYPPNVQGWPGGREWVNANTMFVRYNTAVRLAGGQGVRFRDSEVFDAAGHESAESLVDFWLGRLIQRPIEDRKRRVLIDALGDNFRRRNGVRELVQLIVSMPEYQLC